MIFFDSHVHVGNFKVKESQDNRDLLAYKEYSPNTPENYLRKAIGQGIGKAVIFAFPLMEHPFSKQNDYVLNAAQKYPYFYIPFVIPEKVDALEKRKEMFYGIKDHFYFDFHEQVNRIETLDFAQANDKIYIFHAHWRDWGNRIIQICSNFPNLKVIVAHAARPAPFTGNNMSDRIKEFKSIIPKKNRDNIFFETSTIRDSNAITELVSTFGADHILWGTDFPYYSEEKEQVLSVEKDIIRHADISDKDKEMVFSGTFRHLFQKDQIWIRQALPNDSSTLLKMLSQISSEEQKFLALSLKISFIKKLVKTGSHILVAEDSSGSLLGFLRSSDRHNKGVMVEEVYVMPSVRGKHIATQMINAVSPAYNSVYVKTFATNVGMNTTLKRLNFKPQYSPKGTMITWTR